MRPDFEYYMASLDQWPFEVGVNLRIRERVPQKDKPYRIHMRFDLNRPSDDGLSCKEEDALLAAIEDEILANLDPAAYEFVAAVTHRQARTLVFYSRAKPEEDASVARALDRVTTHRSKVMFETDPDWSEYLDFLYPNTELMHQIQDRRVLKEFVRRGDDPAESHDIEPRFIGMTEAGADQLGELLGAAGFEVTEKAPNGQGEWSVTASVKSPLALSIIDEFRHAWLEMAAKVGGRYQGWSAEVVPVSGKNNNTGCRGHLGDIPDPEAEVISRSPGSATGD